MAWRFLSPYWLWLLLAVPALAMIPTLTGGNPRMFHFLVHPSGEWAARFMIVSMMATPLLMLFKGRSLPRWLRANRRYFGVAAFAYAILHTLFYVLDKAALDVIVRELPRFYIWTGWLAFAIFIPLGVTSMDYAVRKLGLWWKPLQRWTYAAAVLTLLHWASLHQWGHPAAALIHFAPLAALSLYRVWYIWVRPRPSALA